MSRPNSKLWLIVSVLLLAVIAVACGGGEEKTLLNKYFMASKMNDNLTLANIATVSFDPKADGQMQTFSIVSVSEPTREPLTVKELDAELKKVAAEEKTFSETKMKYQDDHSAEIERIVKAEQKNQPVKGKDAEIQKEWTKFRDDAKVWSGKLSDARKKANAGRPIIEISIQDQRNPIDIVAFDGEILTKVVTIEGKVKPETGDAVTKKFALTLQQVILKNVNGKDREGRWVITDRKDVQ
ncbi:MAG: hypothetical protein NTY02_00695 [Acidobacteria bacterium]|nr:hypothetical protein [Acidobacteriota bacterium]